MIKGLGKYWISPVDALRQSDAAVNGCNSLKSLVAIEFVRPTMIDGLLWIEFRNESRSPTSPYSHFLA
jgi:hypothetical protein